MDTDQIILKSFKDLPLESNFIYSRYQEPQCGDYLPTGVLGLQKGSDIGKIAMDNVAELRRNLNEIRGDPTLLKSYSKRKAQEMKVVLKMRK